MSEFETPSFPELVETAPEVPAAPAEAPATVPFNRHAEAGRLGARRARELARLGALYEQEHGLTPGRQRQKQLIQMGRRYESDNGLAPARPRRRPNRDQVWDDFVRALAGVMQPAYRRKLAALAETLAGDRREIG